MQKASGLMVATLAVAALACLGAWAALPNAYQEVEYLESSGTQYINTGVVPGAMFGVTARLNTGTYKNESAFFGTDWTTYRYLFKQQSNTFYFLGNTTTICAVQSDTACTVTIEPTTGDNGTFTFAPDGGTPVAKTVSLANNASTTSLRIFGTGAANRFSSFRLYSFKLYKRETTEGDEGAVTTDVPQLDLVPCEEKATGVYGLYDLARDKFLTNAGTGVFIAGPHVFSSNTLEVRSRDAEAGTVDTSVNGTYADGEVVTIKATPAAGKRFFRWVGDIEKVADELSPETTVTMNGGADLTALFGGEIVVAPTGGDYDNLNDAVAAAKDYDTIIVKDGTYINKTAAFLEVKKPISIVSENGKEHAFFRSEKSPSGGKINVNPAYKGMQVNHEFAVVRGLTFFNFGADQIQDPQGLGVYLNKGLVEDCVISNVVPNHGGAAIHLTGGLARRMILLNNKSGDQGSASGAYLSGGTLRDSVIRNNSAPGNGAGVQLNASIARVLGCQIFSNSASGNGGGVFLQNGLVSDCVITNNTGTGGGVYQTGGTLSGCIVKGNKTTYAQKYGGVGSTGGTIEDCEICENTAYYPEGKQLYKTAGAVKGTTVAEGLHSVPCSDVVKIADGVTVENCVFQASGSEGASELNASDTFAERGFHIHADKVVGLAPLTVNFAAAGTTATPSWNFGDEATSSEATPSHKFEKAGRYTVILTAGGDATTLDILALPAKTYVGKNGTAEFPYDTEAKATPDFQAAHDAVYADDVMQGTVEVLADTYKYTGSDVSKTFTPWLLVNKNVTVQGATGNRDDVVFDAQRKIMTMYLFHPKAVLKDLTISNGRYDTSASYGGTLHMMAGFVTNCVMSKGYANFPGNVTVRGGTVIDSVISEGYMAAGGSDRKGGGLVIYGTCLIANSIIEKNDGSYGSGLYLEASGAIVSNCVIRGNTNGKNGGAGACVTSGLLTHCIITNNTGSGGGGGLCLKGGTVRNCIIADNSAKGTGAPSVGSNGGGGVSMSSGTLENCTVAYNTSSSSTRCDELLQTGGTARNCIFYGKDDNPANDVYKSGGTATYCSFRTTVSGEGNITDDPKLKAPAAGDFTLLFGSPAVDHGMTIAAVTTDILGAPRPVNDVYDIGAYEMDFSGQMGVSFDADKTMGAGSVAVTLTATVEGGVEPYTYYWTIGGQTYETKESAYVYTFSYGSHDVTLKVVDDDGNESDPVVRTGLVKVKTDVAYVSNEGSNEWPYNTWEKATSDWTEAYKAVVFDDETPGRVYVADGEYEAHDNDVYSVTLTDPIEIIGTNPLCKAVFNGRGKYHRVFNVVNARAKVANITVYNTQSGYSPDPGVLTLSGGTVTNCVFDKCSGNGGGLVNVTGGLLTGCVLRNSNAGGYAGGDRHGGGVVVGGGTVENCVISNCTDGAAGGVIVYGSKAVVRNCLIAGCKADGGAGGGAIVLSGTLENCIITNCTQTGKRADIGVNGYISNIRTEGGGVFAYGANAVVRNCLIVGCKSEGYLDTGSAAFVGGGAKFYNNTVWTNTTVRATKADIAAQNACTIAYNIADTSLDIGGEATANGNYIGATPCFKNVGEGDYHLAGGSPARDIAVDDDCWADVADPVDLDGLPRIRFGKIDAGCYENQVAGFMLYLR